VNVFDTYRRSDKFDQFIDEGIEEGHIVAAACRDDCITNMSEKGKKWFEDMGSLEIKELGYRQGFAFIGQFGK